MSAEKLAGRNSQTNKDITQKYHFFSVISSKFFARYTCYIYLHVYIHTLSYVGWRKNSLLFNNRYDYLLFI